MAASIGRVLAWFSSGSDGVVHAAVDQFAQSRVDGRRDQVEAELGGVGGEGRGNEERAVDPVQGRVQAGPVGQVGLHGFDGPAVARDVGFGRVMDDRAHLDAACRECGHDEAGKGTRSSGGKDLHNVSPW